MSLLSTLATDDSIANERDSIGNVPLESGLYDFEVELAYINKAPSGALGLNVVFKTEDGKDLRQTLWMTSGQAKGGKNYYEKDGKKNYLPGFLMANSLALLTIGQEISALETETKVISLYSHEAKAEVPTKVEMVMDLLGKRILAGVIKQVVDKTKKNEAGGYDATGETREENEIDKFFRASDRKTTAEIRAQAEEATFCNTWEKKWAGKTKDRAKGSASGTAGAPKGAAPGAGKKPTTSLFG